MIDPMQRTFQGSDLSFPVPAFLVTTHLAIDPGCLPGSKYEITAAIRPAWRIKYYAV